MSQLPIEEAIPRDDVLAAFGHLRDARTRRPGDWNRSVSDFASMYGRTNRETGAYVRQVLNAR